MLTPNLVAVVSATFCSEKYIDIVCNTHFIMINVLFCICLPILMRVLNNIMSTNVTQFYMFFFIYDVRISSAYHSRKRNKEHCVVGVYTAEQCTDFTVALICRYAEYFITVISKYR